MKTDIEECKNKIAGANNFDSFKRAIRYTFNRELLQSEDEFINKIINESMEEYASIKVQEAKAKLADIQLEIETKLHRCESKCKELEEGKEKQYLNMQYYMEYCQTEGYVAPQEWIKKYKHF